jgi:hypothetical protein
VAIGQSKGYIACAKVDVHAKFPAHELDRFQRDHPGVLIHTDGHHQRVNHYIFDRDPKLPGALDDPGSNSEARLWFGRDSVFVHGQADHGCPIFLYNRQDGAQVPFLTIRRIDQQFSGCSL